MLLYCGFKKEMTTSSPATKYFKTVCSIVSYFQTHLSIFNFIMHNGVSANHMFSLPALRFPAAGAEVRTRSPEGTWFFLSTSSSHSIPPAVLSQLSRVFATIIAVNFSLWVFPILVEPALSQSFVKRPASPLLFLRGLAVLGAPEATHWALQAEHQLSKTPSLWKGLNPCFARFLFQALII